MKKGKSRSWLGSNNKRKRNWNRNQKSKRRRPRGSSSRPKDCRRRPSVCSSRPGCRLRRADRPKEPKFHRGRRRLERPPQSKKRWQRARSLNDL